LLAAYDFKSHQFEVAIAHVDCHGYKIHGNLAEPHGELFGLWLFGEFERQQNAPDGKTNLLKPI
jgi:hypothetical protein